MVLCGLLFLGRFFQPPEYFEMIPLAVSTDQVFDHLFDGDETCFIFFLIQSWPPLRAVLKKHFGSYGRNIQDFLKQSLRAFHSSNMRQG